MEYTDEMSILWKKSHWTLDVFYLHMVGLFSIKIKASYKADIFLMRYRLIHDWLLILTLSRFFIFFFMRWIEQYGKLTSFFYASVLFPLINCVGSDVILERAKLISRQGKRLPKRNSNNYEFCILQMR